MNHRSLFSSASIFAAGALLLGTVSLPSPARADDDDRRVSDEEIRRIQESLTAQGYTDVHDIEVDDGQYEADARHPSGHEVDLELDLDTLEILDEDRD